MAASRNDRLDTAALARRWTRAEAERTALVRLARRTGLTEADAEDCVQEAILKVVPRADVDEARMGSLLATVVKRRAIDLHRRAEAAARASRRLQTVASCEAEAPDVALCDRAEAEWSASLVAGLPELQRQVLLARAEGRSWSEIARELSTSVKAVESAVSRARASVRLAIASTLGIGLALARRWRQSSTVVAGGTAAIVLIAATVPLLHSHDAPEVAAPRADTREFGLVRPVSDVVIAKADVAGPPTAQAVPAKHGGDRDGHGAANGHGNDNYYQSHADVDVEAVEGRGIGLEDENFHGNDEETLDERIAHAIDCAKSGYGYEYTPPEESEDGRPHVFTRCNNDA